MKGTFRKLALLLCLVLAVTFCMAVPAAAASKGKKVKEYKLKSYVYKDGKWKTAGFRYETVKFTYNKHGDVSKTTTKRYEKKGKKPKTYVEKRKLKYNKKGQLLKDIYNPDDDSYSSVTYYKKGVPIRLESFDDDGHEIIEYSYKCRYLKSKTTTMYYSDEEYGDPEAHTPHIYNYNVETKGGYPTKITSVNPYDETETTTVLFYTKGTKKGLIKKEVTKSTDGWRDATSYSYKIKKGMVTSVTAKQTIENIDGSTDKYKDTYSFKYTKKKISAKHYRSMINDLIDKGSINTYW